MDIKRWLRGLAWLIAGAVTFVILLYLILLAINWSDEAPSSDTVTLQSLLDGPPVADADNGYVYALGLVVAADQDPVEQGARRRVFIAEMGAGDVDMQGFALFGERNDYKKARTEAVTSLQRACISGGAKCVQSLDGAPEVLTSWVTSEAWLLERYRQLLRRKQWNETIPLNPAAPSVYHHLINAQELYLLAVCQQAERGQAAAVREQLQEDLLFWRTVAAASKTLFTRMIAVAAIRRNFQMGNLALRVLPAERQADAIPASWRAPITREERVLHAALAGEWHLSSALAQHAAHAAGAMEPTVDVVLHRLSSQFFQPQATSNLSAASLLDTARAFDVAELTQMPQVMEQRRAMKISTLETVLHPYNPVGHILIDIAKPAYTEYGPRAADLEGARRAVLLAATLRSQGIDAAHAEAAVRASPLTDPYTNAPLQWDAESASVVFNGLAKGDRQRVAALL